MHKISELVHFFSEMLLFMPKNNPHIHHLWSIGDQVAAFYLSQIFYREKNMSVFFAVHIFLS